MCYRKHGFPLKHPTYKNNQGATVNNTITDGNTSVGENDDQQKQEYQDIYFTPQQYQALLALIQGTSMIATPYINHIGTFPFQEPNTSVVGNILPITCTINKQSHAS